MTKASERSVDTVTSEAEAATAVTTFNERFTRIIDIFEEYRANAQAGKLTADDEKLASAAIEHAHALVETHKPLPPLPDVLR
jgi:predicted peptidase